MSAFVARPPTYEAFEYDGADPDALAAWLPTSSTATQVDLAVASADADGFVIVETDQWDAVASWQHSGSPGDFVVLVEQSPGVTVSVMSPDDFHAAYVAAPEG
jgi:hypothetical protein